MLLKKSFALAIFLSLCCLHCSTQKNAVAARRQADEIPGDERLRRIKMSELDGKALSMADFKGKPVFLNFWATWCGPCVSEMASIEKVSQQYGEKITFLALSNESPQLIRNYLQKNTLTFHFARLDVSYLDVFVIALPTTLLIDAEGNIVEEIEGFRDWSSAGSRKKLDDLLAK
jgi:thiol-disulfide isomerase/thioredoxin